MSALPDPEAIPARRGRNRPGTGLRPAQALGAASGPCPTWHRWATAGPVSRRARASVPAAATGGPRWIARVAMALILGLLAMASPARSCEVALLLSIDVSGSVDAGEYRLQADGLADALADPRIVEALVGGEAALLLMHWSGAGMQREVLPWTRMRDERDVAAFAAAARSAPRAFRGSDTAVGDALAFAVTRFGAVADCRRQVIDISGDGPQNAGGPLPPARAAAEAAGIAVNAIAIESLGLSITEFYRRHVITRGGFVMSARGHLDYADAIRAKILREIGKPVS